MKVMIHQIPLLLQCSLLLLTAVAGAKAGTPRFAVNGPVLTITVKDPAPSTAAAAGTGTGGTGGDTTSSSSWLDVAALKPSLVYSIASQQPPLPNWLPSLKSIATGLGYQYNDLKRLPAWIEGTAKFDCAGVAAGVQLQVQPSHEFTTGKSSLFVQASRGAHYAFARLSHSKSSVNSGSSNGNGSSSTPLHLAAKGSKRDPSSSNTMVLLETVRASMLFHLPFASLATVRVTPNVNVVKRDVSCQIEAVTGGKGRTVAILNLEYDKPTLAVQYQPDSRNWIKPVIDLYSGKMEYQWILALPGGGGSSLSTIMDPSSAITMTWTDKSTSGGTWVTDIRVSLEGTTTSELFRDLSADVRVRRQFRF